MPSDITRKILVYLVALGLIITSFFLPPTGQIDSSVLVGAGLLVGSYEWLFGTSIKSFRIDREGVHFETYPKDNEAQE